MFASKDVRVSKPWSRRLHGALQDGRTGLLLPVASAEQSRFDMFGKAADRRTAGRRSSPRNSVYLSSSIRETTAEQEVEAYRRGIPTTGAKGVKFKIGGRMSRNADTYPGRTEKMMALAGKTLSDKITI